MAIYAGYTYIDYIPPTVVGINSRYSRGDFTSTRYGWMFSRVILATFCSRSVPGVRVTDVIGTQVSLGNTYYSCHLVGIF